MRAQSALSSPSRPRQLGLTAGLLGGLVLAGCTGSIETVAGPRSDGFPTNNAAASESLRARTGPRRLTNTEYDNTVRDLLGTKLTPAASFVAEEASGFDNVASSLGMTPSQYESYFNAAETLAHELFADPERSAAFVPCSLSGADGGPCLGKVLTDFGTRAFRRPPSAEQTRALQQLYARARDLGESSLGSLEHVLVAMLASPAFLYRTELSETAAGGARALDGYELASRLSYFVWSTLPDAGLFERARDGSLADVDVLRDELTRMLADPRASSLLDNFASQWLSFRELAQHKVLADRYPSFDDTLRSAMIQEARSYVSEFLFEDCPLADFLSAELHFVDSSLAELYGLDLDPGDKFVRVDAPIGDRRGYLGLSAFLTVSSFAQRTSPTLRAKWVLEELLCSPVPAPPPNVVAELAGNDAANAAASLDNVRERLALHRSDPSCAGCHAAMDPIGLGLESFDAIGRSRTKYENGDPIDTTGELPDGTTFAGPVELSAILADDPRFLKCVTRKLLTYAMGRSLERENALIEATLTAFKSQGTLRALIESIVLGNAFRHQTSEGAQP